VPCWSRRRSAKSRGPTGRRWPRSPRTDHPRFRMPWRPRPETCCRAHSRRGLASPRATSRRAQEKCPGTAAAHRCGDSGARSAHRTNRGAARAPRERGARVPHRPGAERDPGRRGSYRPWARR
jgi:hypothetical protein